ncbi:MAG: hypothetical protein LAP21_23865 [Acidobacteriia bacterium]|nr:hypothetical protein [Terriglobia bacterium]
MLFANEQHFGESEHRALSRDGRSDVLSRLFSLTSADRRVWPMECFYQWQGGLATRPGSVHLFLEVPMFRGEFNSMLDNFYFRAALTIAGFAAWIGISYLLLSA